MSQLIPHLDARPTRAPRIRQLVRLVFLWALLQPGASPARADTDDPQIKAMFQRRLERFTEKWNAGRVSSDEWLEITFVDEFNKKRNLWCKTYECAPAQWQTPLDVPGNSIHLYELKLVENNGTNAKFTSRLAHYSAKERNVGSGYFTKDHFNGRYALNTAFVIEKDRTALLLAGEYELEGIALEEGKTYSRPSGFDGYNINKLMIPRGYTTMEVAPPTAYVEEPITPIISLDKMPRCFIGKPMNWILPIEDELTTARISRTEHEFSVIDGFHENNDHLSTDAKDAAHLMRRDLRQTVSSRLKTAVRPWEAGGFNPFEARFIICRVQLAGKDSEAEFFANIQKLDAGTLPKFVSAWRWYVQAELKQYLVDSSDVEIPDGPIPYQQLLSALNQRTVDFMAGKAPTFPSAKVDMSFDQASHMKAFGAHVDALRVDGGANVPSASPNLTPGGAGSGTPEKKPAKKKSDIDDIFDKD